MGTVRGGKEIVRGGAVHQLREKIPKTSLASGKIQRKTPPQMQTPSKAMTWKAISKVQRLVGIAALSLMAVLLAACNPPKAPEPNLTGFWRYEVSPQTAFGGPRRIDIKLQADKRAEFTSGGEAEAMTWKHEGEFLALTRSNGSFIVYKIIAVDPTELRALNDNGEVRRFVRMPNP